MSLQSKLFLFFMGIVVVPLTLAGLIAQHEVTNLLSARDSDLVIHSRPSVVSLYTERVNSIPARVALIPTDPDFNRFIMAADRQGLESILRRELGRKESSLDFAAVLNASGNPIAEVRGLPDYLAGVTAPTVTDMVTTPSATQEPPLASLLAAYTTIPVKTGSPPTLVATIVAGDYLDNDFARSLSASTDPGTGVAGDHVDVTLVVKGRAVASSIPQSAARSPWVVQASTTTNPVRAQFGGQRVDALYNPLQDSVSVSDAALMTSSPLTSQNSIPAVLASILGLLVLAVVGAALLGLGLTRAISRPLRELAAGADSFAAGVYEQHFDVRSADEVGQLARAFNEMTSRLAEHVAELQESREELKRSLTRFGETLRSTHDLDKILQVVLDTSVDALRASGGLLLVVSPDARDSKDGRGRPAANSLGSAGRPMVVSASRGVDASSLELSTGDGIAGRVAISGEPVRVAGDVEKAGQPPPCPSEPAFKTAIWVPVFAQGRIFAVLALYDREDDQDFSSRDLDTVLSLADQAGVAIDNVVLHQEAQRLAITDGMTGIWNHRYFQLRFDQEMDRSARFRRPFCLLLCDIDDFKAVNDTYGHLIGNVVLIDLARRVKAEIRDIDVLARYGGEEFVLILPETDADGGYRAAEKIRRRVAESPFGREREVPVTISIGVACFPRAGTDQTALMRAADVALYQAKARGKNTTVVFEPPQTEEGRAS